MTTPNQWTAIVEAPASMRRAAARTMNELKIEAEAETGLKIWTEPPTHDGKMWTMKGRAL